MANDIVALRKDGPVATVTLQRLPANAISDEVALEAMRVHCASYRCNGFAAANTRAIDAGIDNPRGLSWRRGVVDEPALARRLPTGLEIGVDGRVALPKNMVFGESSSGV
jgi:hypothetical protein